jgi:SAM-dependent methyltransferase
MDNPTVSAVDLEANLYRQKRYEETYQTHSDPWDYSSYADRVRFRTIADTARKWLLTPRRALDVACGLGQLTVLLDDFSEQVFAYDFAPSAVQRTRERCEQAGCQRVQVDVRDATDPGYESDYFDLILMSDIDISGNRDWWCHVLAIHKGYLTKNGIIVACGRIKADGRKQFDENFRAMHGTILDRIYFHDRYWFKARSVVKRVMPSPMAKGLLGRPWFYHTAKTLGRLAGPIGSIHYGVVVRFS